MAFAMLSAAPAVAEDKDCPLPERFKQKGYDCKSVGDFGVRHWHNPPGEVQIIDSKPVIKDFRTKPRKQIRKHATKKKST